MIIKKNLLEYVYSLLQLVHLQYHYRYFEYVQYLLMQQTLASCLLVYTKQQMKSMIIYSCESNGKGESEQGCGKSNINGSCIIYTKLFFQITYTVRVNGNTLRVGKVGSDIALK